MDNMFIEDFLRGFDDSCFPEDFLQAYEPMECLSHNQMGETLLVRDKKTSQYYVAKCYNNQSRFSGTNESELLKKLNYEGLPAFIGEYQKGKSICIVREYAEGLPLNQFVNESTLSESQVISIIVQLCDILTYLHGHTPPVIHRDIKPQNIIINSTGKIKLIDFGISRFYDKEAKADTVFFGTQEFSPPEQYGFSQTDCRSDIFSLGVLLCWLLTGKTDLDTASGEIHNSQLSRIVRKCTAFAPKDRYADAGTVKNVLLRANPQVQKINRMISAAVGMVVLALCIAGGIWLHNYNSREIFTEDHIPAFITSEDLIVESVQYLNEKYGTDLFSTSKDAANMGYVRQLLFKIFWPEVVADWSSLKDDNGIYPGVRVAMSFSEKHNILNGINRPDHLTFGDVAVILANADKEKDAMK